MPKAFLLTALLFKLGFTNAYANELSPPGAAPEFVKASFAPGTSEPSNIEEFASNITIYSLIIGVYALYWFKQKA